MDIDRETAVRSALFKYLDEVVANSPDGLVSYTDVEAFFYLGERIAIQQTRGRGIHKPATLQGALSIKTTFTPFGKEPPYKDMTGPDGFPRYKYEGTDPNLYTNVALRVCMDFQLPLVYFIAVRRGVFSAVYPVYILGENQNELEFVLGLNAFQVGADLSQVSDVEKRYATREARIRLHQPIFREQVLHAYRSSCAVCRLRHTELLDAAHIISDSKPGGDPVVQNGIALCKIHHAAYDRNLLGIHPDYRVVINENLLYETDGPMLKYGLQDMHGASLSVPRQEASKPEKQRLAVRYEEFMNAS
jgi:putative restriction endonuclease